MGYLLGRVCYDSFADWSDAYYGSLAPVYLPGVTTYEVYPKKAAGVWQVCRSSINSSGTRTAMGCTAGPVASADVSVCSADGAVADGALIGISVGAAFLVAWGAVVLARHLR